MLINVGNPSENGMFSSYVVTNKILNAFLMNFYLLVFSGKDTDSSALEEDGDDLKALEARIRCMTLRKKPSQGKQFLFCWLNI